MFILKPESKKIVIYHTGAIGDLLVSTAALHAISLLYPASAQTLVGNSLWKDLILPSQWPQIEFFVECERKNFKHLVLYKANTQTNQWDRIHSISGFTNFLKKYDIGICLRNRTLRFAFELIKARVKIRVGAHRSWLARFLYTHFSQESRTPIHMRDKHLDVLSSLNPPFVKEQKEYWKLHGLPKLKSIFEIEKFKKRFGSSFILINPTASIRAKAWDANNFKLVVDSLLAQNKNPVVVGTQHETAWLMEVATTDQAPIYQPASIFELCDLIAAADIFLTNTSALQFIAASTGTCTITLMGSANPLIWGPLGKNDIVIRALPSQEDEKIKHDRTLNKTERGKMLEASAYARISVSQVLKII